MSEDNDSGYLVLMPLDSLIDDLYGLALMLTANEIWRHLEEDVQNGIEPDSGKYYDEIMLPVLELAEDNLEEGETKEQYDARMKAYFIDSLKPHIQMMKDRINSQNEQSE